jgi:YidC/Oxa1 family membrane protein insertase
MSNGFNQGFGGKDEGFDQKRMILAVAISAGILFLWTWLFPQAPVQPNPTPAATPVSGVASTPASAAPGAAPGSTPGSAAAAAAPVPSTKPAFEQREIARLHKPDFTELVLSNVDGRIQQWSLEESQYRLRDDKGEPAGPYPFIKGLTADARKGIFLAPELRLSLGGKSASGAYSRASGDKMTTALTWTDPVTGVVVTRTYTLQPDDYSVDLEISLSNPGGAAVPYDLTAVLSGAQNDEEASGSMFSPPIYAFEGICKRVDDFERMPISEIINSIQDPEEPTRFNDGVTWAGVDNRYFMTAVLPGEGEIEGCEFLIGPQAAGVDAASVPPNFTLVSTNIELTGGEIAAGATVKRSLRFYGGPKKMERLQRQTPPLADAIDFGFFSPIAVPMLWLMRQFYNLIGNWGWAIIFLTVMVKLLTLPLTHKQYKSMASMKKLQPELKALQTKYKDDKTRLQQEMMGLYKEHKVNPLSGCLPMFLMMPIYFSLYRTIYSAVELYQADYMFWIKDLSQQDPYYITPILLGLVMIVQTRLSPSTGDAMQQKVMMWVMPIMFSGMMLFLPSGLVLYIFVNTVLGIAQQYMLYKRVGAPTAVAS